MVYELEASVKKREEKNRRPYSLLLSYANKYWSGNDDHVFLDCYGGYVRYGVPETFQRFRFYLFLLGIITPGVCIGLGLAMFFQKVGIDYNWYSTGLIGHLIWTTPFTFLIMLMTFSRFDTTAEEAASVLGASPWTTFRTMTFPIILPGIAVSALFGFTLSFDEFVRTIFLGGSQNTLPLLLLASLTVRVTPMLYALGTVTTVISLIVVVSFLMFLTHRQMKT